MATHDEQSGSMEGIDCRVIGKHMRDIRNARKMTQSHIAEKMGIGIKYYSSLETGQNKISLTRFVQFLAITKVNSDSVLAGSYPGLSVSTADNALLICDERKRLELLISKSSNDAVKTMYALCVAIADTLK